MLFCLLKKNLKQYQYQVWVFTKDGGYSEVVVRVVMVVVGLFGVDDGCEVLVLIMIARYWC
jgi:hypothetical protein